MSWPSRRPRGLFYLEDSNRSRVQQTPARSFEQALAREIHRLPSLASDFYPDIELCSWKPTLAVLLAGTRDPNSTLYALNGLDASVVRHIYSFIPSKWAKHVTLTLPASCVGTMRGDDNPLRLWVFPLDPLRVWVLPLGRTNPRELIHSVLPAANTGYVAWASCGRVIFPEPADRNVNMMPFVFGDKSSLPEDLQCYYDSCIQQCPYMQEEVGKVGFLTVHESYMNAGDVQRRPGLHIESPGVFSDDPNASKFAPGREHRWGRGVFITPDRHTPRLQGGIYMASSVSDTSEVWDALVDKNVKGIVDRHGGCEHLRRLMHGVSTKLEANQLIWMTDCTPHDALAQKAEGYRQFFRVVTSHVSHWYADHSTPNPLVPLPEHVTVIHGNKFATTDANN